MNSLFRSIFSFSQPEVTALFSGAKVCLKMPGLTVLSAAAVGRDGKVLIITSRKSGNAVLRNKVRRRLRALFWMHEWFKKGHDFIIITYRQVHQLSYLEIESLIKTMIIKKIAYDTVL